MDEAVLERSADSTTYEWRIERCEGQEDRHELARVLLGNDGLHRCAYTQEGPRIGSEARTHWLDVLARTRVTKSE